METLANLPIVLFKDQVAWKQWLEQNHTQQAGLWLKIAKKASGKVSVTYAEALEEALCYGWIDGQKQSYDHEHYLQKFTPRRPKSIWSKVNVEKVSRLKAAGHMQAAGLAAVASAQADGRWDDAYDSNRTMTIPPDFQAALDTHPQAKAFFATLNKTNTYAYLWRIQTTKNPANRQTKIDKFIAMLETGETPHIYKSKSG